jgi:ankyrin repeat protein
MPTQQVTFLPVFILLAAFAQADTERDGPMQNAAQTGNIVALEQLLKQGMDVDAPGYFGATALHRAVKPVRRLDPAKQLATIDFLLERGADVNARTEFGNTPLSFVSSDDLAVAFRLIDAGADVNVRDNSGSTPLAKILVHSHPSDAEFSDLLARMIALGLDINAVDVSGTAVLHVVAPRMPRLVDELISVNADPNIPDGRGQTALHLVSNLDEKAFPGVRDAIEALIAAGADINAVDKLQHTPLARATTSNSRILLAHSAMVDQPESVPPLHVAAFRGEAETVRLLLAAGADPRRRWRGDNAMDRAYEGLQKNAGGYKRAATFERGRSYLDIIEQLDAAGGTSVGDEIVRFVGLNPLLWRIIKTWALVGGIVFSPAITLLLLAIFASYSKRARSQPWRRALARASRFSLVGTVLLLAAGVFLTSMAYEAAFFVLVLVVLITWTAAIMQLVFWYALFSRRMERHQAG